MYTFNETMDVLADRYDPDMLLEIIEPTSDELVEGLSDVIQQNLDKIKARINDDA